VPQDKVYQKSKKQKEALRFIFSYYSLFRVFSKGIWPTHSYGVTSLRGEQGKTFHDVDLSRIFLVRLNQKC